MSADRILAGRYELLQPIGRGGMGQVWAALDTRLRRQVAVKTVDLDASTDAVAAERFRQEAQATAALSHPNIVTIFDSGLDGATAYIVMELLRGPSLEELVRTEGELDVDRALDYAGQVASALGAAHEAGIVHRDIKPSNLMLDARGAIKVVDFGIARLDQERSSQLTATATVVGSAPYLSPEQATGGVATPQSDLYSLGCVLITLLTGQPPFSGEHPLSVLHQHLSATPPMPSSRRAEVGAAVDQLVGQLLAKSPADRPASARDVATRIQEIRRGHAGTRALAAAGTDSAPTEVLAPAAASRPAASASERVAPVRPPEPARGSGGWLVAALLALAVIGGLAWLFLAGPLSGSAKTPSSTRTVVVTSTTAPTQEATSETTSVDETTPTSEATTTPERTSETSDPPTESATTSSATPSSSTSSASTPTSEATSEAPTADESTPASGTTSPDSAVTARTIVPSGDTAPAPSAS